MVAGYGQDDKVCAYTSLTALMNVQNPKKTAVCILSDKEEIRRNRKHGKYRNGNANV